MDRKQKNKMLQGLIKPLAAPRGSYHIDWHYYQRTIDGYKDNWGGFELNPDFQRGHVWTKDQQKHYIENIMRGVVPFGGTVIKLNCPNYETDDFKGDLPLGFQCIDGLQRVTAFKEYMAGNIKPFGLSLEDFEDSSYQSRSHIFTFLFEIYSFKTRAELLRFYLDLNTGGTDHTEEEINRVKQLLQKAI